MDQAIFSTSRISIHIFNDLYLALDAIPNKQNKQSYRSTTDVP